VALTAGPTGQFFSQPRQTVGSAFFENCQRKRGGFLKKLRKVVVFCFNVPQCGGFLQFTPV
jgi:hypothetical protein